MCSYASAPRSGGHIFFTLVGIFVVTSIPQRAFTYPFTPISKLIYAAISDGLIYLPLFDIV